MSNIFEIDGEIEDNFDENGDDKNSKKDKKGAEETNESLPVEDADTSESDDNAEVVDSSNDEETPWYEKYIPDEEASESSTEEPEAEEEISAPVFDIENDEPEIEDNDIPSVDDVTQEEIDEVLAELDEGEKELAASDLDIEENNADSVQPKTQDEEDHESFDDIFPKRNKNSTPVAMGTWIFLTLFLISLTLLSYYQFYDGQRFSLDFSHRSAGNVSQLDSLTTKYAAKVKELEDQQKIIEDLTTKIQELNAANLELVQDTASNSNVLNSDGTPAFTGVDLSSGTYYQVQLIALQQYHPSFGNSETAFYVDKEDGFSKMLMGAFEDENQAKTLYEKVRRAGFNDAFIVKKENGKRVDYNPFE
jgi:hypothetical protein